MLDLVLVGGGLPNCLLAWRLHLTRPDVSFMLVEEGSTLGGSGTTWFRGTDVTKAQLEWLWVLCAKSYPSHDMERAGHEPRRIGGAFHAIDAADLQWKVAERLKDRVRLRAKIDAVGDTRVTLGTGEVLDARAVIDGRDVAGTVPWPAEFHTLRIAEVQSGLEVPVMGLREAAPVSLPTGGDAPRLERPIIGPRAGLFHATTGEVLPMAVDVAEVLPTLELEPRALTSWLQAHVERHWSAQAFFRKLNRKPRANVFDAVHGADDDTIARFYAGTLSLWQRLRLSAAV